MCDGGGSRYFWIDTLKNERKDDNAFSIIKGIAIGIILAVIIAVSVLLYVGDKADPQTYKSIVNNTNPPAIFVDNCN